MKLGMILASNRDRTRATVVFGPANYSVCYPKFLELKKLPPLDPSLPVLMLEEVQPVLTAILQKGDGVTSGTEMTAVTAGAGEPAPRRRRNPGDGQP